MRPRRDAFTLFELILAIALSATLLALIGTAINLYLLRVDAGRTRVEEAQLARSILAMIADDIRATTIYQPQDTSAIAQLMASTEAFDVDSVDDPREESSDGGSDAGGVGSSGSSFGSTSSSGNSGASSTGSSSTSSSGGGVEETLPLGLNGTLDQIYVDVTRMPRREELFGTITGYTNAPLPAAAGGTAAGSSAATSAAIMPPSDLKTVCYFIRPGVQVEPGSVAATSLPAGQQTGAGGLVRQEISRNMRVWAEQSGNSALLESGQTLIAPEVVHIEFRYFDGVEVTDVWDMLEKQTLPLAIEVRLWLASSDVAATADASQYNVAGLMATAHEYRQTVFLPMAELSNSGAQGGASAGGSSTSSSSSSSGSSSSGASSSSSTGSSFGEP